MRHQLTVAALGLLLAWGGARAQDTGAGTAPSGTVPSGAQEQIDDLREIVTEPEGAIQTTVSDVKTLKKIKFSGYVQARYENHEGGAGPGSGTRNNFTVRRARLKAAASPVAHAGVTLQADFSGTSPSLKDAFVDWFPLAAEADQSWVLSAGQMKWPFGYQVVQSSSVRETPERALVIQRLFPGERDRGVMVTSPAARPIWLQAGVFNGAGSNANDDNNSKDVVGRARWSPLASLDLGASFYVGRRLAVAPAAAVDPTPVFNDANGNGVMDAGEQVGIVAGKPAVAAREENKTRYGSDIQWWPFTGLSLKAEYVTGKEFVGGRNVTAKGWYALGTYSLTPGLDIVTMYDTYDDTSAGNSRDIWHFGFTRHLTDATRARVFYQIVNEPIGPSRDNNVVMAELISLF
ncbi:MAG: hypothetical protein HY321_12345 [Armatimonadetes bacterium]|nr:hypothetical protein [Armatimonadota bacterium]